MRNYWYPLIYSRSISSSRPTGVTLLGDPIVLFRDRWGKVGALEDRCPHRSVPLSLGRLVDGRLECKYHGWQFGTNGDCLHLPTLPALAQGGKIPKAACASSYPCVERMGLVWVWPGDPAAADPALIQPQPELDAPGWALVEGCRDFEMDHGLMIENLLDPSHLPFTHEGTLAKRSDAEPLEIDMIDHPRGLKGRTRSPLHPDRPAQQFTFDAPCCVRLDLDLGRKGWKLVQVHYSVPLAKDRMRLFWRICQNFLTWVPGMSWAMKWQSDRIIDQDVAMLSGQQRRVEQGAKPWGCPVKADAISARYRVWRERNETPDTWFQGYPTRRADPIEDQGQTLAAG